jgi:RND family efflux transporter MFP subunit
MSFPITRIVTPIVVVAIGIGLYMLLHATKPEPEKSDEAPRALSVYTEIARADSVTLTVKTQGDVRARTDVDIVAQVGGRIVAVSPEFTEGGQVEPGIPLVTIEDTDYQLSLRQAEARVAGAQVGVQQALADADVARRQLRNDLTASPLALKKPQVAEAKATLAAAEAELEQARLNLKRTEISLPFTGRLVTTRADIGQYLTPGSIVGRAFATDVVEIRLPLNSTQLASLGLPIGFRAEKNKGLPVIFQAEVAGEQQNWQGKLVRLDASIDPDTRMLFGIAQVQDPYGSGSAKSGMPMAVGLFVEAQISGRELPEATIISIEALRAGDMIFLIDDKGLLEMRRVDVVHKNDKDAVITGNLKPGEEVITSAIRNPISGMALTAIPAANDKQR